MLKDKLSGINKDENINPPVASPQNDPIGQRQVGENSQPILEPLEKKEDQNLSFPLEKVEKEPFWKNKRFRFGFLISILIFILMSVGVAFGYFSYYIAPQRLFKKRECFLPDVINYGIIKL